MTARGRVTNDWDPMAEDYNNSSYDAQYADNDGSTRVQLDHTKLYVTSIPNGLNESGLRSAFEKFGQIEHCFLSKNPQKKFALITFEKAAEASFAMMKLNNTKPLNLMVNIAHKANNKSDNNQNRIKNDRYKEDDQRAYNKEKSHREYSGSVSSRRSRNHDEGNNDLEQQLADDMGMDIDRDLHMELESIKLEKLKLKEEQLMCKQKMLLLKQNEKRLITNNSGSGGSNRRILPDGRIIVQSMPEKNQETDASFTAGAGDSNGTTCSCQKYWREEGSSTPSTCVICDDRSGTKESSEQSKTTDVTVSRVKSDGSKKCEARKCACKSKCEFGDFYSDSDTDTDETNRLIQLRNSDYLDIVDDELILVVVLAGYPKSKMRLRQMERFQRCLTDVINMQLKESLLKKVPSFFDYYLNRGAIVFVCKDLETRDWMVRVTPGLQERMCTELVLLNSNVKRLCLAVLKIPKTSWPATAEDCFKLLQYFNPALKISSWKIYAREIVDDVECTSFLIDRISGEIIRGPNFKNVIDYDQMDFELTGYTEIYNECLLSGIDEDLSSVASRVKLLGEIKSAQTTPRIASTVSIKSLKHKPIQIEELIVKVSSIETQNDIEVVKEEFESLLEDDVKIKIKDIQYMGENSEMLVWAENNAQIEDKTVEEDNNTTTTSLMAMSENTESVNDSADNLLIRTSTLTIDSNRGIAYHRRTNYLHVDNELKSAITLEGYPQNKLEGTHIRRLKHLFKEYLHKDMKSQRFANMIVPKYQDIYLSNGAVIYICDSLESKEYLTDVLPKFVKSTGLKLVFRDVTNLVRYTRIVMRLPKELAHFESIEIISKLQERYPGLKPDCWKYYSDVAGKQKRQFGVDPESLHIIRSPEFEPIFKGEKIVFRIIDRKKRDVSCDKTEVIESVETKRQRQAIIKNMYIPIDQEITKTPLTRIRTNHYSDLIADDLKLYVGPVNYPDSRIDETLFHCIKNTLENIVIDELAAGKITEESIPKYLDMYLFDGVIFVICQSMYSRIWIEDNVAKINDVLKIKLKSTEFRGAVGIISMAIKTDKETDEVIAILQQNNPRLRTKYWRKISTVRTTSKLDVVLQIDKLSAEVISSPNFIKSVGNEEVNFKLGHLQSLIKPKSSLEELTKAHTQKQEKKGKKKSKKNKISKIDTEIDEDKDQESDLAESPKLQQDQIEKEFIDIVEPDSPKAKDFEVPEENYQSKIILKIPLNILPESEDDLNIIFDILEDKNPGLNTEIWQVFTESAYPSNGKFILYVDKHSLSVIKNKDFDSRVGGEKLMFYF